MVVKLRQSAPDAAVTTTAAQPDAIQHLIRSLAVHAVAFTASWRSADSFVVDGYRSPIKPATEDAAALNDAATRQQQS